VVAATRLAVKSYQVVVPTGVPAILSDAVVQFNVRVDRS
jgi:hypothetical protein